MIKLCEKVDCTGCGACYNICNKGAISMKSDEEGFLYPMLDYERCVGCGLCQRAMAAKLKTMENDKHPLDYLKNDDDSTPPSPPRKGLQTGL